MFITAAFKKQLWTPATKTSQLLLLQRPALRNTRLYHTYISKSKMSLQNAHVDEVIPLDQGKWIQTRKINYTDAAGQSRVWEMAVRTTRTETTNIDAVSMAAFLSGPERRLVLVKQFRPPCAAVVIELPAGLIDPNESVESTAVRELVEETGYHGTVRKLSVDHGLLFSDPGLTNANMALVTMDVDLNDERNKNPKPELEDGEYIDVFTLPVKSLLSGLAELAATEKCVIDARLYHLAIGIDLALQL